MKNKRIIFIYGRSNRGKTTLSLVLKHYFKEKINHISLDALTKEWLIENGICKDPDLGAPKISIIVHVSKNHDGLIEGVCDKVEKEIYESDAEIYIIEGIITKLWDILRKKLLLPIIRIKLTGLEAYKAGEAELIVNNKEKIKYNIPNIKELITNPRGILKRIEAIDTKPIIKKLFKGSEILESFILGDHEAFPSIKDFVKKLKYQSFKEFGKRASSDSAGKLKVIKPFMKLHPWSGELLDVGCNAGFFCFKLHEANNKLKCLGIDKSSQIKSAKYLNNFHYHYDIEFLNQDIFETKLEKGRFKFGLALSVFHYFRDKQKQFLRLMKQAIRKNGYLLIEVGVSAVKTLGFVEKFSRSVDKEPCHFPSERTFESWAEEAGFRIVEKEPSVKQAGDSHPRILYILKNGEIKNKLQKYDEPEEAIKEGHLRNNGLEIFTDGEWVKRH